MQGASWNSQMKKLGGIQVFNFSASNIRGPLVLWKEDMGYNAIPSFWARTRFLLFTVGTQHFSRRTKIKGTELLLCTAKPCHSNPTLLFGSKNSSRGISENSQFLESFKAMAPHSGTLAWKIPWTEKPGRLQSMGSLRVGHDWATSISLFTFMHWRRKWHPTPVFLPGESQGRGSLEGCRLWGRTESDTTEAT